MLYTGDSTASKKAIPSSTRHRVTDHLRELRSAAFVLKRVQASSRSNIDTTTEYSRVLFKAAFKAPAGGALSASARVSAPLFGTAFASCATTVFTAYTARQLSSLVTIPGYFLCFPARGKDGATQTYIKSGTRLPRQWHITAFLGLGVGSPMLFLLRRPSRCYIVLPGMGQ